MSDDAPDVSRRTLLYGLATAGIGAGTGAVTTATVIDVEAFEGNLYSTGEVDIEACWEDADASSACTPDDGSGARVDLGTVSAEGDDGSGLVRVRLPDEDANNPAFIWFRTSCPVDDAGLESDLCFRIWRDQSDQSDQNCNATLDPGEEVLASGTLCEVLDTLHGGVLLDADPSTDADDPFEPGDEACLGVEWELESDTTDDSLDIDFEFHATQSRHADPENPWPNADCGITCQDGCNPGGISFVAFCAEGGFDAGNPITSISTAETNDDGEPIAVEWSSDEPVDYVVVKNGNGNVGGGPPSGNNHAMFTFDVGGVTSGTTRVNTVFDEPDSGGDPQDPCPDGSSGVKYEYNENNDTWEKDT